MTMNYEVYRKKYDAKAPGMKDYFSLDIVTNGSFAIHVWDEGKEGKEDRLSHYVSLPYSCIDPILASKPSSRATLIQTTGMFRSAGALGTMSNYYLSKAFYRINEETIIIEGIYRGEGTEHTIILPFSDFSEALVDLQYLRQNVEGDGGFDARLEVIERKNHTGFFAPEWTDESRQALDKCLKELFESTTRDLENSDSSLLQGIARKCREHEVGT